ncbi:retrovirus-related pol polyprotein from transposon TNT 1-94 [Tanacetum coccineum]
MDMQSIQLTQYRIRIILVSRDSAHRRILNNNSAPFLLFKLDFKHSYDLRLEIEELEDTMREEHRQSLIVDVEFIVTLALAEESRSKMLLKHKDNMMLEKEKQVDTTPIDYAALNQLYKDFPTRFVPQTKLSAEQAFWSQNSVDSSETTLSIRPTNVEVPKELPKVSMVNTSLKKLKHHLANFDVCLKLETELQTDFVKTETYDKLFKRFTILEKHCISLEVDTQLKHEIFQRENSVSNQSVPSFDQLFELNELKAQSQEKDTVIKKLKERIKSLSGKIDKDKIKQELEEIETINIELDHRVTKLIAENEHLKQTYKQLYDSIKPARIRSKEQCDDLINQVNIKSAEISDLNASLQEKALAITALKDELRKLKGKALVDNNVSNHPSDPELHQVNVEPITPKLLNKRTAHSAYIKHSQEEAAVLRDLVDHIKANYPLDPLLESAFAFRQHTCYIRNLEGVDLLTGSRGDKTPPTQSLYTLSLGDMMASSPICLLSKASKTKSWLWHRRLSHLNFRAINHLARHGLVRGLPKLKFEKDHLCSACALGKSTKKPHKPKSEDTNQEKLYLLHMDLCGPIRVASVNGKKYILVIVNDYSRFTWVKCLRSKDEAPAFIINFLKMIQLTTMDSEHSSSGPTLHEMTLATISSGLMPNPHPSTPVDHPTPEVVAQINEVIALVLADSTGSPSSTTVDQDAPSPSNSQTTPKTEPLVIPNNVEEDNHDIEVAHIGNDPYFGVLIPEIPSDQSLSSSSIHTIVRPDH